MKTPLAELLPQAAPMVLLTDYDVPESDSAVVARVAVSPESPFYDPAEGGVPGCVALEWMAQAMALCTGIYRRRRGLPPKIGFVLGSRRLEVSVPAFPCGAEYAVKAECSYFDESFGSFDCSVVDASGAVVASGRLTAFQPEGDVTAADLEAYQ